MTTSASNIDKVIAETTEHVLTVVREYLLRCKEPEIRPVLDYCLNAKAACDRALLLRLGHEACGGNWRDVLPAMAAAELMDFSVIAIDDILDESPRRMSKETHYVRFGAKKTIIAAAMLKSIGSLALSDCLERLDLDVERTRLAFETYEGDHLGIYVGQYLDIAFEDMDFEQVPLDRFVDMIRYTTGVQIGAMASLGAILANAHPGQIEALREFGTLVGTIFQMRDDFIDYVSDEALTGKTPLLDWTQQKKRFPVILAVSVLPEGDTKRLLSLFAGDELAPEDVEFVLHSINSDAVIAAARNEIESLREAASRLLCAVNEGAARDLLMQVLQIGAQI